MKMRLNKTLAAAGIASRRASDKLIFEGRVSVNGEVVKTPQTLVDRRSDRIDVNGKRLGAEERKVYFLFNKPVGYLCTCDPTVKSVLRFFEPISLRLFTVGRLDRDTSGLLLITNDGTFANRVIHPSYNVTKEYLAKTSQEITPSHLEAISKGTEVEGVWVKPVSVKKIRRGTVKIVVAEGKKHEVRQLLAGAKLTVKELKRIRIGPLTLSNLAEGTYRELTDKEINLFM